MRMCKYSWPIAHTISGGLHLYFFLKKKIVAWGENNKKGEVFIKRLELKTFIRGKKLKGEWKQLCVMAVVLD